MGRNNQPKKSSRYFQKLYRLLKCLLGRSAHPTADTVKCSDVCHKRQFHRLGYFAYELSLKTHSGS